MSDKGWCYVCNSWECKEEKEEKKVICEQCKREGRICYTCLYRQNEKKREQLKEVIQLLESMNSHKGCKSCCGLRLPSLGWYREIESLLAKIYG
jgi:hypothetical protein